jgi:cell wall assembly regulator SMI1
MANFSASHGVFTSFFDEVNKYVAGVHNLNEGTSIENIEALEKQLNIKLPSIYKEFLQMCNGGELFIPGTVLAQVYEPEKGTMRKGESYLNESFQSKRRWPKMPKSYLIIADLNYGDAVCIDLDKSNGNDAEIIQWDHETGNVSRKWKGFVDWLMNEMEEGTELVDYDGEDKE